MSSRRVALTNTFLMLAAGGLAACDMSSEEDYEDGHFYCSDGNGYVVDEAYCDDGSSVYDSSMFIYYMGTSIHTPPANYSNYPPGSKLPTNGVKIPVTDQATRTRFGLPARGAVPNGTVKSGVVGKGGAGSAPKAGSGGGAKSGGG